MGVLIRYYAIAEKLILPMVTLLAPVSPVAWLPVAIFLFGIGNGPAIFMVFIALFFTMTLATITQIDLGQPQLHQRGAHNGRQQAADLYARNPSGGPARSPRRVCG